MLNAVRLLFGSKKNNYEAVPTFGTAFFLSTGI